MQALTVEYLAVRIDAYEAIGGGDEMHLAVDEIAEERVGHPDLVDERVVERDVADVLPRRVGVAEARIVPDLAKVAVHRVLHVDLADAAYLIHVDVEEDLHGSAVFKKRRTKTKTKRKTRKRKIKQTQCQSTTTTHNSKKE